MPGVDLAGDSHQIDLVLPSAAPLNTLVDPTVIAVNKVLRGRGAAELPPAAYEFARAAGMSALATDVSLAGHNIVDGDVLALFRPVRPNATGQWWRTCRPRWRSTPPSTSCGSRRKTALDGRRGDRRGCARRGQHAAVAASLGP